MVDSTAVRAHQVAAGAKKRQPRWPGARPQPGRFHDQAPPELRRLRPNLRPGPDRGGQAGDCPQAFGLLVRHLQTEQAVVADRAYDADYVRVQIAQAGAVAVIPGKKNRLVSLEHDAEVYKERNQIERAINGLKRFRAVATRFDKRAANYFATCCLIAALTRL